MDQIPVHTAPGLLIPPSTGERRNSIISNISRFWKSRPAPGSSVTRSGRPTKTFEVPLFLSASRSSGRNNLFARGALPAATRSRTSTRSIIESEAPTTMNAHAAHNLGGADREGSDMYGSGPRTERSMSSMTESVPPAHHLNGSTSSSATRGTRTTRTTRSGSRSTQTSRGTGRSHRRILSRRAYRDPKVNAKAKICFSFGVTLVVAVIIYFVLAFTGIARNTMFHALSILFILALTGIFCHQLIRMFMLIRMPRGTGRRATHGRRHATSRRVRRQLEDDALPEKPIQIHMASDDGFDIDVEMIGDAGITPPPPVYGNLRTSTRMNPDFVHWKHIPPSPLTPTYNEALGEVLPNAAYRPPSYLSEGGTTQIIETQTRDVEAALDNIHPLERERMRDLAVEALEGRTHA